MVIGSDTKCYEPMVRTYPWKLPQLKFVEGSGTKVEQQGLHHCFPSIKDSKFFTILIPNQILPIHMEGSQYQLFIRWNIIILEVLVCPINPSCGILSPKHWKFQFHRARCTNNCRTGSWSMSSRTAWFIIFIGTQLLQH